MISSQYTVRPFVGLDELETLLDGFVVRVGDNAVLPGGHLLVNSDEYRLAPVRLEFAPDDAGMDELTTKITAALRAADFSTRDVEIAVIASSSYLKIAEILYRRSGGKLGTLPRAVSLGTPNRPRSLMSPRGGAHFDVYMCLTKNLKQRPLRPWRRGTWLAHVQFSLSSELSGNSFRMRSLGDEERARMRLPKGTLRYVEISAPSAIEPLTDETSVNVWIDHLLLARLSANPDNAASRALQLQLFVDVVAAVLASARRQRQFWEVAAEDLDGSLFGRVLNALASGRLGQTAEKRREFAETLLQMARDEPDRFLATAEASVGLLRATMDSLEL